MRAIVERLVAGCLRHGSPPQSKRLVGGLDRMLGCLGFYLKLNSLVWIYQKYPKSRPTRPVSVVAVGLHLGCCQFALSSRFSLCGRDRG